MTRALSRRRYLSARRRYSTWRLASVALRDIVRLEGKEEEAATRYRARTYERVCRNNLTRDRYSRDNWSGEIAARIHGEIEEDSGELDTGW